jgi:hypothetical protein
LCEAEIGRAEILGILYWIRLRPLLFDAERVPIRREFYWCGWESNRTARCSLIRRRQAKNLRARWKSENTSDELEYWINAIRQTDEKQVKAILVDSVAYDSIAVGGQTKAKSKGGKRPLIKTNPMLVNLYDSVLVEWREGRSSNEIIEALGSKKDVSDLAKELKKAIDAQLIRKAKKYRKENPKK